jgi:hypothetical protein
LGAAGHAVHLYMQWPIWVIKECIGSDNFP